METRTSSKDCLLYIIILFISAKLCVISSYANVNDTATDKYLISTKGCKIPAFPIISNNIEKLMVQTETPNCTENIHLLDYNSTHIWIVEESLDMYNVLSTNDFYCCYRYFYAEDNIGQITYGTCVEFSTVIEARHEFTRVECYYLDNRIYDDFFIFSIFTAARISNDSLPNYNILLFGIESMSRMNFLRTMPKTSKFLKDKGSIQLLGYNKVGDNSLPNLFPLLLGKSFKQVKELCVRDNVIDTNKCIFLWTKFQKAGYHTALASDSIAGLLGTYEYSLPKIPTDFYLQPFMFETRNIFKNKHYNFHQCLRNKYFYKLLLNWSAGLLKKSNKRLFGVFWEESISHENFNLPLNVDDDHYYFLKELENSKYLDNSIVILFSDHGTRWGKIAQTKQGRVENRLPLFEIIFPKQFQNRYPLAFKNFKQNRYHLTSPYDIHETLLDLVQNNFDDYEILERSIQVTHETSKISLFLPIPNQRTCRSIGISEHWCTCQRTENAVILNEEHKLLIANHVIKHLNRLLKKYPQCHQLKTRKILNAYIRKEYNNESVTYEIVLQTSPGYGIFESTLHRQGGYLSISGTVTRLNLYRYTSQCIQNDVIKMYCSCK